ncbi:DUF4350 domain-containing protein [Christiangramia forsetii]|uniref:DUF4350 domain-containing protein n=2 Tax=Christiangramia forsetii TaxID=411153 RepID=A0M030_CHRFK|nr:DUF4350 domain-containing protein [Christiangramia forsetii]GGG46008.1 hypothetical protein GCM10011532_32400 [Christiangramia forsetii]CAL65975.1 conserved hypothetical protein, membrane [Christiangramia forsetii KT0803]
MNRTYKIAFGLFLLLVISLAWLESSEPEPINWNSSYTAKDKIPLGAYIFYESWKTSTKDSIQDIKIPPYEYLHSSPENGTYFFLNNYVNFDDNELDELLEWVSRGNKLFVSAYSFGENLSDTLNIEISTYIATSKDLKTRPSFNLVNPDLQFEQALEFDQDLLATYFSEIDTLNNIVLGTSSFGKKEPEEKINFIKTGFGDGEIYLHTAPQAFSNYFLLKNENYRYSEALLSYLSNRNILWDSYYKSGKGFFSSPLYILLNNRPLKWAYYFVIIAAILFILFEGKRKQRSIPVVEPLQNKSFEFTQTMAHLYLEQKKYHELGLKKITLFMEFIRNRYRLDPSVINDSFYRDLAAKSENSLERTKRLFEIIYNFQENKENNKDRFFELSKSINTFKKHDGKSGNR